MIELSPTVMRDACSCFNHFTKNYCGGESEAIETGVTTSEPPQGEQYAGDPYLQFDKGRAFPVGDVLLYSPPLFDKLNN